MSFKIKKRKPLGLVVMVGWDEKTNHVLLSFPSIEARLTPEKARVIAEQLKAAADKVEPSKLLIVSGSA